MKTKNKKIDVMIHQLNNKNQFVLKHNNMIYFQSYDSLIAAYNKNNNDIILGCDWDYSNTTRKHLYIFLNEYCYVYGGFNYDLYCAKNKRQFIQNCIKSKKIKYDSNMR